MKKTDELSVEKTLAFAQQCYVDKTTTTGQPIFVFCQKIAARAEDIAHRLYRDLRPEYVGGSLNDNIAPIIHCALLYDVLNTSACTFENVAEITNVQIAAMVAAISRDFRLVETKRDMELRGRLSQSPVGAQIVFISHIICNAQAVMQLVDAKGLEAVPKTKKLLAQMDGDLFAIHAANKYYTLRLYVHAARNLLSDIGQKIKQCRHQAKIDKLVLQNTKTLRESAAEQSEQPALPKKKRARQYAKKRTVEPDSE